ncbi:MAG: hypothetical protein ACR65U_07490 [Methylocystis sp.]
MRIIGGEAAREVGEYIRKNEVRKAAGDFLFPKMALLQGPNVKGARVANARKKRLSPEQQRKDLYPMNALGFVFRRE